MREKAARSETKNQGLSTKMITQAYTSRDGRFKIDDKREKVA